MGGAEVYRDNYWLDTRRPISALLFFAPFIALYEIGIVFIRQLDAGTSMRHSAAAIIQNIAGISGVVKIFSLAGVGRALAWFVLSGLIIIILLVAWQIKTRAPWRVRLVCLGGMMGESILYGTAIFSVYLIVRKFVPGFPRGSIEMPALNLAPMMAIALGGGFVEEFILRFAGLGLVFLFLRRSLEFPVHVAFPIAAVLTTIVFAAFHLVGPFGENNFNGWLFGFRLFSGLCFSGLFGARGLGVTAGVHGVYNFLFVAFVGPYAT